MPRWVVPRRSSPRCCSPSRSKTGGYGITMWARSLITSLSVLTPCACSSSSSARNDLGLTTIPWPMTQVVVGERMPLGISRNLKVWPSTTTVWPALSPPCERTTMSTEPARRSMTFPLPSSPHCPPMRMVTLMTGPPGIGIEHAQRIPSRPPRASPRSRAVAGRARPAVFRWRAASRSPGGPGCGPRPLLQQAAEHPGRLLVDLHPPGEQVQGGLVVGRLGHREDLAGDANHRLLVLLQPPDHLRGVRGIGFLGDHGESREFAVRRRGANAQRANPLRDLIHRQGQLH